MTRTQRIAVALAAAVLHGTLTSTAASAGDVCGPIGCEGPPECVAREQTYECEHRRAEFLVGMLDQLVAERDQLVEVVAGRDRQIAAAHRRGDRLAVKLDRARERIERLRAKCGGRTGRVLAAR